MAIWIILSMYISGFFQAFGNKEEKEPLGSALDREVGIQLLMK